MNAGRRRTDPGGSIGAQVVAAGRRPAPLQEPADEKLLVTVDAGDREAFADLSERIAPHVLGVTLRVVRDRSLADEVAQEVVVEVWRKASRFDPARGSVRDVARILGIPEGTAKSRLRDGLLRLRAALVGLV